MGNWQLRSRTVCCCGKGCSFDNPQVACEAYRQSTENLKSYMQHQWSLVGGMAGTFREMDFVLQDEYLRAEKGKRWQN